LANLDPHKAAPVTAVIAGAHPGSVKGEVLTADAMDAHNTFDAPDLVHPVAFDGASIKGGRLTVKLPPMSVVVLRVE